MNNKEVREYLNGIVKDEEILNKIVILEGDEYSASFVGFDEKSHRLVYDYHILIDTLAKEYKEADETLEESKTLVMDWFDYNTRRTLSFLKAKGYFVPIFVQ